MTRAHIRVWGSSSSLRGGLSNNGARRLLPEISQLYNNSPQGLFSDILQDIMESELGGLGRLERRLTSPFSGGS